jgi:hypothetical protein
MCRLAGQNRYQQDYNGGYLFGTLWAYFLGQQNMVWAGRFRGFPVFSIGHFHAACPPLFGAELLHFVTTSYPLPSIMLS